MPILLPPRAAINWQRRQVPPNYQLQEAGVGDDRLSLFSIIAPVCRGSNLKKTKISPLPPHHPAHCSPRPGQWQNWHPCAGGKCRPSRSGGRAPRHFRTEIVCCCPVFGRRDQDCSGRLVWAECRLYRTKMAWPEQSASPMPIICGCIFCNRNKICKLA